MARPERFLRGPGGLELDLANGTIRVGRGPLIRLLRRELKILAYLLANPNRYVPREELRQEALGREGFANRNVVQKTMFGLRNKFGEAGVLNPKQFIRTHWDRGYGIFWAGTRESPTAIHWNNGKYDIWVDPVTSSAGVGDTPLPLTPMRRRVLELLFLNMGNVVTLDALREAVWGELEDVHRETIEVTISQLRQVLQRAGVKVPVIENVRAEGYRVPKPPVRLERFLQGPGGVVPMELKMLDYLLANQNRYVSSEELWQEALGREGFADLNIVNVTMFSLRKKLGEAGVPDPKQFIRTVRDVGYIIGSGTRHSPTAIHWDDGEYDIWVDPVNSSAGVGDTPLFLTPTRRRVLELLFLNMGNLVTPDTFWEGVWGKLEDVHRNRIEVAIHELRKELRRAGVKNPDSVIETVRWDGYRTDGYRVPKLQVRN